MHAEGFHLALWMFTVTQPASPTSSAIHNFVWSVNIAVLCSEVHIIWISVRFDVLLPNSSQ